MNFNEIRASSVCSISAAILSGSLDALQRLLSEKKPVDVKDNRGYYPLHIAIGEMGTVISDGYLQALLAHERCLEMINEQSFDGATALMLAVSVHSVGKVKLLLGAGADPNVADHSGTTPLMASVRGSVSSIADGNNSVPVTGINDEVLSIVEVLLAHRADVDCRDVDAETICHYIARLCYDRRVIELLVFHDANLAVVNCWQNNMLHLAAYFGNHVVAEYVRDKICSGSESGDMLKSMLRVKDVNGLTPLEIAGNVVGMVKAGHKLVMHYYLQCLQLNVTDIFSTVRRLFILREDDLRLLVDELKISADISADDSVKFYQRLLFNIIHQPAVDSDLLSHLLSSPPQPIRLPSIQYTYFSSICPLGFALSVGKDRYFAMLLRYFADDSSTQLGSYLLSYTSVSHLLNPLHPLLVSGKLSSSTSYSDILRTLSECDACLKLSQLPLIEDLLHDHINVARHSHFSITNLHALIQCGLQVSRDIFQIKAEPYQTTYSCTALCGLMSQFGSISGVIRPAALSYLIYMCRGIANLCPHLRRQGEVVARCEPLLSRPRSLAHSCRHAILAALPVSVLRARDRLREVTSLPDPLLLYLSFEDAESQHRLQQAVDEQREQPGFANGIVNIEYDGMEFRETS